jgi:hypothetical protein
MHLPIKSLITPKYLIAYFFTFLFLIGLLIFKDYGINWDEFPQRSIGGMNLKYLVHKLAPSFLTEKINTFPNLHEHPDKDHGPFFETFLYSLESLFNLNDEKTIYQFRHLITFITFLIGTFAIFDVIRLKSKSWKLGLLGAVFFVLSPRFFAESFYNSKDLVFASLFAVNINILIRFSRNPTNKNLFILSLVIAMAISTRQMAVILIPIILFMFFIKYINKQMPFFRLVSRVTIFLSLTSFLIVLFYPYLWESPLQNFVNAFASMSKFSWGGQVLYMGKYISAQNLPWHYSMVWILLTTPVFYSLLFMFSSLVILKDTLINGLRMLLHPEKFENIILLTLSCLPLVMVIVLKSTLYDGWRHLYFIYPSMIILATLGWKVIFDNLNQFKIAGRILVIFTIIYLLQIMIWMYKAHPLQNVFFNSFVKGDLRTKYELDYWGVGNILALNFIANIDKSPVIYIKHESQTPLEMSFKMLNKEDAKRFRILNTETNVNYYAITNYRCLLNCPEKPIDIKTKELEYSSSLNLLKEIKVDNQIIISIYKSKGY